MISGSVSLKYRILLCLGAWMDDMPISDELDVLDCYQESDLDRWADEIIEIVKEEKAKDDT